MDKEDHLPNQIIKFEFQDSANQSYTHLPPFDPADYREYVEEFDLTPDQQDELLRTLWQIMAAFVDLGFGVSSIQNFLPGLAQPPENCEIQTIEESPAQNIGGAIENDKPEGGRYRER